MKYSVGLLGLLLVCLFFYFVVLFFLLLLVYVLLFKELEFSAAERRPSMTEPKLTPLAAERERVGE